jgi:hypothetical protein
VADALAERSTLNERLAAQQALTEATVQSYRLSQARYTWDGRAHALTPHLQRLKLYRFLTQVRHGCSGRSHSPSTLTPAFATVWSLSSSREKLLGLFQR